MEQGIMPLRMSRTLTLEVEIIGANNNGLLFRDRDVAPILLRMEKDGEAMRCLNKRGQLIWRLTPQFKKELAAEKRAYREEMREGLTR